MCWILLRRVSLLVIQALMTPLNCAGWSLSLQLSPHPFFPLMTLRAIYLEHKCPRHSPSPSVTLWPTKERLRFWTQHCFICLVAKLCPTLLRPHGLSCQAPLSMGFSRQEYWSGLPFPSPGDLPNPGIEPECPAGSPAGRFFTTSGAGEALTGHSSPQLGSLPLSSQLLSPLHPALRFLL